MATANRVRNWPFWTLIIVAFLLGLYRGCGGELKVWKYLFRRRTPDTVFNMYRAAGAIRRFRLDVGRFPTDKEGLKSLLVGHSIDEWNGPYLDQNELLDAWMRPLVYHQKDARIEMRSRGPDGVLRNEDDTVMHFCWNKEGRLTCTGISAGRGFVGE